MNRLTAKSLCLFALLLVTFPASSLQTQTSKTQHLDIEYAKVGDRSLQLDIYLPHNLDKPAPLVIWIHGGGWVGGSRKRCPMKWLTTQGYVVASISYRFSQEAKYPAQIHDCKAALRWLKANANKYNINPNKIAVSGGSAGGHLALLLGTTANHPKLDGKVGTHLKQNTTVHAVVDLFGPTDFLAYEKSKHAAQGSFLLTSLLGGPVSEKKELAKLASPRHHVTKDDPPVLMLHGDKDTLVPISQSLQIQKVYQTLKIPAKLITLKNTGHGGRAFGSPSSIAAIKSFLDQHLKPTKQSPNASN